MRRQHGFTLVEVMVATAIMALIGSMSWVGLDALIRSQHSIQAHGIRTAQLQIGLQQWALDLDKAWTPEGAQPMGWDGKVFRLTRAASQIEQGVVVVAWAVREGATGPQWMRWQSEPFTHMNAWQQAWEEGANWGRNTADSQGVVLLPAMEMDVFLWSAGGWVNGQTSAVSTTPRSGLTRAAAKAEQRERAGIRLMLTTEQGAVQKDWAALTFSESKQ